MASFPEFESFVVDKMSRTRLSGVSVALVEGDEVTYARGFGCRDSEKGLPATPETLYCIGSVTKSFTCVAIMQLQEAGKLNVDDPVDKYLNFPIRPKGQQVLLRHLMSHTSGIPGLGYAEALIGHGQGLGDPYLAIGSVEDLLAFMSKAGDWVHNAPGERWFYLNEGFALLGEVVARVSGESYEDYVTKHILLPLGMTRSIFNKAQFDADQDTAVPYLDEKEGRHRAGRYLFGRILADGGLISSANDMGKYVAMYLNQGRAKDGTAILSPESIEAMETPAIHTPPQVPGETNWIEGTPASQYAFGLGISPFLGRRLVGHGGSVGVSTAGMAILPEAGVAAVAVANGSGYGPGVLAHYLLARQLGEDPYDLPVLDRERALDAWQGEYETYQGTMRCRVTSVAGTLRIGFVTGDEEDPAALMPYKVTTDAARFMMPVGASRLWLDFEREGDQRQFLYERYLFRRTGPLPTRR